MLESHTDECLHSLAGENLTKGMGAVSSEMCGSGEDVCPLQRRAKASRPLPRPRMVHHFFFACASRSQSSDHP